MVAQAGHVVLLAGGTVAGEGSVQDLTAGNEWFAAFAAGRITTRRREVRS
jgi:hypothetical protein